MGRPYTGKVSVTREERPQSNGAIYIYEKRSWYDREAGYTRKSLSLLGIKDPENGGIIETRPKLASSTLKGQVSTDVTVTKQQNALISILRYVSEISGVTSEVTQVLSKDKGMAQKILTLSWYAFTSDGRNWARHTATEAPLPRNGGPVTPQRRFHCTAAEAQLHRSRGPVAKVRKRRCRTQRQKSHRTAAQSCATGGSFHSKSAENSAASGMLASGACES